MILLLTIFFGCAMAVMTLAWWQKQRQRTAVDAYWAG